MHTGLLTVVVLTSSGLSLPFITLKVLPAVTVHLEHGITPSQVPVLGSSTHAETDAEEQPQHIQKWLSWLMAQLTPNKQLLNIPIIQRMCSHRFVVFSKLLQLDLQETKSSFQYWFLTKYQQFFTMFWEHLHLSKNTNQRKEIKYYQ